MMYNVMVSQGMNNIEQKTQSSLYMLHCILRLHIHCWSYILQALK
jgi:hypothetical protein